MDKHPKLSADAAQPHRLNIRAMGEHARIRSRAVQRVNAPCTKPLPTCATDLAIATASGRASSQSAAPIHARREGLTGHYLMAQQGTHLSRLVRPDLLRFADHSRQLGADLISGG